MGRSPDHSFVVPAYRSSPHLADCLASLASQTLAGSEIVVSTSTPSGELEALAARFGARYAVHAPNAGIGRDWNMAVAQARRRWVTIAHQDDLYLPDFVAKTMRVAEAAPDASLVLTDYVELLGETERPRTRMLRIKRLLLELGFLGRRSIRREADKLRLLRFGCPIACPSVTLGPGATGVTFREDLKVDLDWEAWIRLARRPGAFCFVRERLMAHRIHAESETSVGVRGGVRAREDAAMFASLWPTPIATLLARAYAHSYEAGGH
ncbi:glycosyltransferase family 2 protein [Coralloluteibacterium thermophilus]|uniref:Glycosyltransferase family 2 protein n=1 Tax=Coralloluteibacterium thermophilum TaxID=2707049 RepID=A0ABV9NH99_9GAMM